MNEEEVKEERTRARESERERARTRVYILYNLYSFPVFFVYMFIFFISLRSICFFEPRIVCGCVLQFTKHISLYQNHIFVSGVHFMQCSKKRNGVGLYGR